MHFRLSDIVRLAVTTNNDVVDNSRALKKTDEVPYFVTARGNDNRIRSLCVRENISVITLAPELQAYADKSGSFLHGFSNDLGNGHWNALGHRVAGELITEKLKDGVLGK